MESIKEHKDYYINGKLKRVYGVDDNGVKQGKSIEYYQNGEKIYETNFKDGKEDGEIIVYEKNSTVKYRGEHKNGKRHGVWIYISGKKYYINGKECNQEDYKLYLVRTRLKEK